MERFGPYELEERIAVGGMAEIFRARRNGPGGFAKQVALKRVLPELAQQQQFRKMFADEARLCATLSHSGLVQVFDYGEVDDTPYLVMEWIDGCDLAALLADAARFPPALAVHVAAELARTLASVHDACNEQGEALNVVHRDISPGNIMVTRDGEVKLGDFGVAKARGRLARTDTGQLKGTLAYLAPEQASGGAVDGRTDIYALGLLLFEMLTGEGYMKGEREVDLLAAAVQPDQRRPIEIVPSLEPALDAVVARALAPDPEGRYRRAPALEQALRDFCPDPAAERAALSDRVRQLKGQAGRRRQTATIDAEAAGTTERLGRAVRRLLRKRVTTFAVVFLLGVLLAAGLWLATREGPLPRQIAGTPAADQPAPQQSAKQPVSESVTRPRDRSDGAVATSTTDGTGIGDGGVTADSEQASSPARTARSPREPSPPGHGGMASEPPSHPDASPALAVERSASGPDPSALLREADRVRRARGLVAGDDGETDRLRAAAAQMLAQSAPTEPSVEAVAAYHRRVEAVAVNRAFVDAKMRRVSRRIGALGPDSPLAGELSALSQQAMRRAMAGDFEGANRLLNQILERARR